MEKHRDSVHSRPFASSLETLGAFKGHRRAIQMNEVVLERARDIHRYLNLDRIQ